MSKSALPNGGYTLTTGSNYMLDGFQFDTEYGGGPYEKARLPEAKGLSSLPSGMIPSDGSLSSEIPDGIEADFDLDLGEMTKDASEQLVPLVDHSWLASEPEPDLSGLRSHEDVLQQFAEGRFENQQANQIKALQDAWGDGSTTGLDIIPNENRLHAPYANPYHKHQSKLPGDDYRQKVEQALRKTAYGTEPLDEILSGIAGTPKKAHAEAAEQIISEYGLNGRVYIKEAHFPGLFNGRWDEVVNRRCASALYIISEKPDCAYDRFLGKKVVASVDEISWSGVASALLPKLKTCGVKVASQGTKKEIVRKAFLDLMSGVMEAPTSGSTWYQMERDLTSGISLKKAREVLGSFEAETPYIESQEERALTKTEARLQRIASQLISQSLLEADIVQAVLHSERKASEKIERLYILAAKPAETSSYEGHGKEAKVHTPYKSQLDPNAKVQSTSERDSVRVAKKCQEKVAKLIQQGLITLDDVERVTKTASTAEGKLASVYEYLSRPAQVQKYLGDVEAHYMTKKSSIDPNAHVDDREARNLAQRNMVAQTKIAKMVESGLISYDDVAIAIKGKRTPEDKIASVFSFLARPQKTASYNQYDVTEHRMTKNRNKPLDKVPNLEKRASASLWKEAHSKVSRLVSSGLLSQEKYDSLSAISDPNDFVRKAFDLASKPRDATEYQGDETAHILNSKKSSQSSESEVRVATWLRQKMTEGSAGQELDVLLSSRFSQSALTEHQSRIAALRNDHEGLSGHAYVDAGAYMTSGTEGCDKGALIHRANQLPALLKTSKCDACVFNTDGVCQKYNKQIIASATEVVANKNKYQKEMIRLANGSDADRTASLFTPSTEYDPNEFGLSHDGDVDLDSEVSVQDLGDVLFGGYEV